MSTGQRILLAFAGALLVIAELCRLPLLLESFHNAYIPLDVGGIVSLSLSVIFAVQLFRGRWLIAAMCFLALFLAIEIWATLQMPVDMDGDPFRYRIFMGRLPFMVVHLVSFVAVLCARMTSETLRVNRKDIITRLKQMTVPELVSVFREALAPHHPGTRESGVTDDRYILAVARRDVDPDRLTPDTPCTIEVVAYPDPAEYGDELGPDWGLCQSGTCHICGLVVCSNVKHGLCPSCGTKVFMT